MTAKKKPASQVLKEQEAMRSPRALVALLRARGIPVLGIEWAEDESVDHEVKITPRVSVQVCSYESGQNVVNRSNGNPEGDDFTITHYRTTRDLDVIIEDIRKAMQA